MRARYKPADQPGAAVPALVNSGHWTAARLTDKLFLLKKLHGKFGESEAITRALQGSTFTQSRGGPCTGIFSFQQMGQSWRNMQ
jgi:hypothetical protein